MPLVDVGIAEGDEPRFQFAALPVQPHAHGVHRARADPAERVDYTVARRYVAAIAHVFIDATDEAAGKLGGMGERLSDNDAIPVIGVAVVPDGRLIHGKTTPNASAHCR